MIFNKKKILFVIHIPPPIHGAAIVGQFITKSNVINNFFNCRYISLSTSKSIDEIGKGLLNKIIRYFKILWNCLVQFIKFKPDLCYLTLNSKGIAFYKDIPIVILSKIFKVKIIYHFHNKGVMNNHNKFFDNFLYQFVFKNSNVILLAKELYLDISKYVHKNQVSYCANGVPDYIFDSLTKNFNNQVVQILFLSNLIESKGVYVLLEACKILRDKKINFYCTFIGNIGDVKEVDFNLKVKDLELTQYVKYVGKKYSEEKSNALKIADIFVLPSFNDCFPLVLLEAMQFFLPIISTNEGGIPNIVEDNQTGYIVPKNDIKAIAEKLEILIKSPRKREKMGIAGNDKYKKEFTMKIFENRLIEILNKI